VKDMLLQIILLLTGFWLFFVLRKILGLFLFQWNLNDQLCKLVVIMGDQEESAEGFLRKLFYWRNRLWPGLDVEVLDCGTSAGTKKIIRLLAGELNFSIVKKKHYEQAGYADPTNKEAPIRCLDARNYDKKSLIRLPGEFFRKNKKYEVNI
jgi:hypothetical protein